MQNIALGHRLDTLNDGLTTFANGERVPLPLVTTDIKIQILAGAATVKTTRRFCNTEDNPIEAIMTFPVGFDAVATGLAATIDGRRMVGVAKGKTEARETYEAALDEGRMSVLHEEILRGIHIMSVGALPPGAEVFVALEQVVPLTEVSGKQFLRLPMTSGQLYGNSPLMPADDFVTSDAVRHEASLRVTSETGRVYLGGLALNPEDEVKVLLNRAIELIIEDGTFGCLEGRAADGRAVALAFTPTNHHDTSLDLHILVDRSGSTECLVNNGEVSIWHAIRAGLNEVLGTTGPSDRISLWQFDHACQFLGTGRGEESAKLTRKLQGPQGGTELAGALNEAIAAGAKDILVLTDGQTWSHIVDDLNGQAVRISSILVGKGSLDANIGHLCAMTGGQVLYAPGQDVASPLRSAFEAIRTPSSAFIGKVGKNGPEKIAAQRGGITIEAHWSGESRHSSEMSDDAIGRFAAALALPLLDAPAGAHWARAHSLCTHSTSLVLVDVAGQITEGFSQMRKISMMTAHASCNEDLGFLGRPDPSVLRRLRAAVETSHNSDFEQAQTYQANFKEYEEVTSRSWNEKFAKLDRERKGTIHNLITRLSGKDQPQLEVTFANFEWDRYGDALLSEDFSSLNRNQLAEIQRIAKDLGRINAYNTHHVAKTKLMIFALGLIAIKMSGRLAERFARRALCDAPEWVTAHRVRVSVKPQSL